MGMWQGVPKWHEQKIGGAPFRPGRHRHAESAAETPYRVPCSSSPTTADACDHTAHEHVQFSIENTGIALNLKLGSHWRQQRGSPPLSTREATGELPALDMR